MVSNIKEFGKIKIALDTLGLDENYTFEQLRKAYKLKTKIFPNKFVKNAYNILINNLRDKKMYEIEDADIKSEKIDNTEDFDLTNLKTPDEINTNVMLKVIEKLGTDDKKIESLREYIKKELRCFDSNAIKYFTNWNTYDAIVRYLNEPLFRESLKPVDISEAIDYFSDKRKNYHDYDLIQKNNKNL